MIPARLRREAGTGRWRGSPPVHGHQNAVSPVTREQFDPNTRPRDPQASTWTGRSGIGSGWNAAHFICSINGIRGTAGEKNGEINGNGP